VNGCTSEIRHATWVATDKILNLLDNDVTVAGLQGTQRSIEGKNLTLLSGEEFDL
jgi:hypothetical protein